MPYRVTHSLTDFGRQSYSARYKVYEGGSRNAINFKEDVKDEEDQQAEHNDNNKNKENQIKENQQAEHDLQARGQLEEPHTPKVSESHLKKRKVFKYNLQEVVFFSRAETTLLRCQIQISHFLGAIFTVLLQMFDLLLHFVDLRHPLLLWRLAGAVRNNQN